MAEKIRPFHERVQLSHPTERISSNYVPVTPRELLWGLDWDNRHAKYDAGDVARLEQQLEKTISRIRQNPKFILNRLKSKYEPIGQYLDPAFAAEVVQDVGLVKNYMKYAGIEEGTVPQLAKDQPERLKELGPEGVVRGGRAALEDVRKKDRPIFGLDDMVNVSGDVLKGVAKDVEGRGREVWDFTKNWLGGKSAQESLASAKKTYAATPGVLDWIQPSATSEPTVIGDWARTGLSKLGEGVEGVLDAAGRGVGGLSELASKPFGGMAPETEKTIGEGSAEGLKALFSLLPVGGVAKGAASALAKKAQVVAPAVGRMAGITSGLADAESVADAVKAAESVRPSYQRRMPVEETEGALAKAKSNVKEFFDPFENLPDKVQFEELRGAKRGVEATMARVSEPIISKAKALPAEERKAIFEAVQNKTGSGLSPEAFNIYTEMITATEAVGESLVKRGYLEKEAFNAFEGNYLPNVYVEGGFLGKELSSGKRGAPPNSIEMPLGNMEERAGLTPEQQAARGLVTDAAVPFESYMRTAGKVLSADNTMNAVLKNKNWVWREGCIPLTENQFVPGSQLEPMVKAQRATVEALPIDAKGPAVARLRHLEELKDQYHAKIPPANFRKVPDTPGFGPLRGMHVHEAIANDMVGFCSKADNLSKASAIAERVGAGLEGLNSFWKVSKTVLNVPAWVRNFGEAFVRLDLSGVPYREMPRLYTTAAKEMRTNGKLLREAQAQGLLETTYSAAELRPASAMIQEWCRPEMDVLSMQGGGMAAAVKNFPQAVWGKGKDLFAGGVDKASKMYQLGDNMMSMAKFISERQRGSSATEAANAARFWGMDYTKAAPSVNWGRRFLTPFIAYPYKISSVIAKAAAERPQVFAKYAVVPWVYSNVMDQISSDYSSKEVRSLLSMYPESVRQYGSSMVLPYRSPSGHPVVVSMDYFLPWSGMTSGVDAAKHGDIRGVLKTVSFGNAFGDFYSMIATSRGEALYDSFTGKPLYNPLDSFMSKVMATAGKQAENFAMPSFLTSTGTVGKALTLAFDQEVADRKDYAWRDVALSFCGVATHPISPQTQRQRAGWAKSELGKAWSDYQQNTKDLPERIGNVEEDVREKMVSLEHPEINKPPDISRGDYEKATLGGGAPDSLLEDANVLKGILDPKGKDKFLFNMPASFLKN